jgi:hypothetical protein
MYNYEATEMEAELSARDDYRYELMSEARILDAQAGDEMANGMGFTSWDAYRRASQEWAAKVRAAASISNSKTAVQALRREDADNVPF